MFKPTSIESAVAIEILDSRGNPTIETEVTLANGAKGTAAVPSGASTGTFEAVELRDGDPARYLGKGCAGGRTQCERHHFRPYQRPGRAGAVPYRPDFDRTGRNGKQIETGRECHSIGFSGCGKSCVHIARAAALPVHRRRGSPESSRAHDEYFEWRRARGKQYRHAGIPDYAGGRSPNFTEALRWCSEVFHSLKKVLAERGLSTAVGDEGGFAPDLKDDQESLDAILLAIEKAGYMPGSQFRIAMDPASSEWYQKEGTYFLPKKQIKMSTDQLIAYWEMLVSKYPIISIEDGLAEEDWEGWQKLTRKLGRKIQLVGGRFVCNQHAAAEKRNRAGHSQFYPDQIKSDRHANGNAGGRKDCAKGGIHRRDFPPIG